MDNNGKKQIRYCPKCNSRMFFDKDSHGEYWECLICSFIEDIDAKPKKESYIPIKKYVREARLELIETADKI